MTLEELHMLVLQLQERIVILESKNRKLPHVELPPLDKATRLKAQLFHNIPKQGKPEWTLKLYVWDQPDPYAIHGDMLPFYYYLSTSEKIREQMGEECAPDVQWIGCLHQRRVTPEMKGQRPYSNQTVLIKTTGELYLGFDGSEIVLPDRKDLSKKKQQGTAARMVWDWLRT